jgi:predicted DNA-binding transcriptional regulator YafY
MLNCSKQTVLRLVEDIRRAYGVEIDEMVRGNQKYYQLISRSDVPSAFRLTEREMQVLYMCRAFTEHLLGKRLFDEAAQALEKSQTFLSGKISSTERHFSSLRSGYIDYTSHQDIICTLIEAMNERKICKISYRAVMSGRAKTFYIKPLKIFSYQDAVYLHARMAKTPGKRYYEPDFDPLLAIHRFKTVEITELNYEIPQNYDFDKIFKQNFGVMKEDEFEVEIEFEGWAAKFVKERIWSPDQKIEKIGRNIIRLTFAASSEPELMSWLLSFGEEAKLLRPGKLLKSIIQKMQTMASNYSASPINL